MWILYVSGIGCPIKYVTSIPCPTCGVTRALFSLVRGDIKGYLYYHPGAIPLLVAAWLGIHRVLFTKKKSIDICIVIIVLVNFIYYIYTLFHR